MLKFGEKITDFGGKKAQREFSIFPSVPTLGKTHFFSCFFYVSLYVDLGEFDQKSSCPKLRKTIDKSMSTHWAKRSFQVAFFTYPPTWIWANSGKKSLCLKDFPQFFPVPDTKHDSGNVPKEWRRFHKDSWVFNCVTIPFPNSHFAISSSAGIVNYSMGSHEKKSAQTFTFIFLPQQANIGFRFQNIFRRDELICFSGKFLIKCCGKN